jgi:diaminohydroxyphosphoribosylaminopyrimidine deaminase / 5-amino-6-(5-phosphoribosylamino)uracil reductase
MTALPLETWRRLLRRAPADAALSRLYGPLLVPPRDDRCFVLGWISGHADIVHTHRLRALFDAVVIGAATVRADDPQLTTREVEGPSPVRVVLDPNRRLDARYRVFHEGPETLVLCAADAGGEDRVGRAPVLRLPRAGRGIAVADVLSALAARGLRRIFVEGGGITVSRFLSAGALDRLHVTIAPLLIGSGIPAFSLPERPNLADALRFDWSVHQVGDDLLVDIPLSRIGSIGTA